MKSLFLAGALILAGCATQPPQTPAQAMVDLRAGLGTTVATFNIYAAQRPFCDQPGAKPPPLCADRQTVIQGNEIAQTTSEVIDQTAEVLKATTLEDKKWAAIADAVKQLADFRRFVGQAKGETP